MSWAAIVVGGVSLGTGIYQKAHAASKAKKAQRSLEGLQTPKTATSATIEDYYRRASASPYSSLMYRINQQNIQRGTATGINALQDRRSVGGLGAIIGQQNSASLRNAAGAEQNQNAMLRDAVRLKSGDESRVFNINEMLPYNKLISLYSAQAAGANQQQNAAQQDISSGLNIGAMGLSQLYNKPRGGAYESATPAYSAPIGTAAYGNMGYESPAASRNKINAPYMNW